MDFAIIKKNSLSFLLLIVMLTLDSSALFAESKIRFEKVDIGFNSAVGAGFVQDNDGFFWIGSQTGLIKWNGSGKLIYTRSSVGLTDNTVTAVTIDQKGRIWVGTMGGLNMYDKTTDKFNQYIHDPADLNSLSHESIGMINHFQSLIVDKGGRLWIATQNGLNSFNPENNQFVHFMHDPENSNSISSNVINAIFQDSGETLWIGTKDGLNKLNKENGTFIRYKHNAEDLSSLSNNEIYSIGEDDNGNIWIGTERGLNQFNRNSNSFIRFYSDKGTHRIIADNKVTSINKDKRGHLWLCHYTKGSVTLLDPLARTAQFFKHDPNDLESLPINDIKYVYEGRQGILWFISTTGGNMYKYDSNSQKFITFKHNPEKPQSLNGNSVLPIFEDRKGIVWIGTDKSKLNKFDKSTGKFTYIPIEGYHPYAFFEDNNGIFWVGETTGRLSIFDRTTETYIKSYNGLSSSFITHIAQDSKDHFILWITTHKDGLVKFNINNGEYTHYRHNDKDKYSLSNNSIWGFSQEEDHLWLGTWGGGLNKFDKKGETFTAYKHDPQNPKSISSNVSGNLFITSQGELYISTLGGGLNKFNKQDETFEYYNTSNGLFPSDNLQGILEDKNGNLWIASSTEEIINFNIRTKEFKTYGPGDGIEIGGPWFVANHISPDGQMWFGGPKGVTAFYPENIKNNEFKPPVYITSLTQGGDPLETGKALETLSEIKVSWKKPFFEFKAAALNYTRPQHNRYKYKLVGWDSEWFNSGVFRNGRYSNLKGGKYTLRICASNNDGVWCQPDQEVALKIEVSSPFWETAWFKIIVLFLFLMVILFVIVYLQKLRSEIKERKKTKKDLMESEKKYRDLIDSAPDLRYRTDMEGKIIFVSQSVFYLAGYTVEEAIGMKMAEEIYVNPVERTTFLQSLQKNGYITDFEAQLKHKDGTIWWASTNAHFQKDKDGNIIGVEGVTRDITERKQAEEALLKNEEELQAIVDHSVDAIGVSQQGIHRLVNPAYLKMFGYQNAKDLIGKPIFELISPDERKRIKQFVADRIKGRSVNSHYQTRGLKKDGTEFDMEVNVAQYGQKDIKNTLVILRDVTDRNRLEEQLRQSQKMESIGNLAGGIAHDFNNLLFPILGMSEMLLEDLPQDSLEYENAQEIFIAGKRAGALVQQILAFSRQSEHKMTPVKVQNVLKEVLKLSRSTIPTNIEIQQNIQQNCGLVMADPTQVHQVAMNLITNAFHAVEEKNGTIDIKLKEVILKDNELPNSVLKSGQFIRLSVSDNGIGMSQSTVQKIFEPYFTTKEQGKGTGLGLAVVYGIVKEHGGDIKVYSEMGKGSTFSIYLPLMTKSSQITPAENVEMVTSGTENILLVDDEVSVAKLEGQMLARLGYQTTIKTNSVDALSAFKKNPEFFDLVISDMTMPGMTGDQLADEILSIKPDTPIIICTGFSERINKELAETSGVKGFLMKPVVKLDMAQMVRKVLDEAIQNEE